MRRRRAIVTGAIMAAVCIPGIVEAAGTLLKNLAADQVVREIRYCKGEYTLVMATGAPRRYNEFNLRFKTDGSRDGPEVGKPALLPAGMQGDRAQVIFSGLDDLKRLLVERCGRDG